MKSDLSPTPFARYPLAEDDLSLSALHGAIETAERHQATEEMPSRTEHRVAEGRALQSQTRSPGKIGCNVRFMPFCAFRRSRSTVARRGGLPGTLLVLSLAFCVVVFTPCACGSSGAWATASQPSGSSLLVTLEPANSAGASARGLAADARIFERRASDLGIAKDVSVSIRRNTIVLDLRGPRAQADLGELGQMDQLLFRPVLSAANKYIPPVPKKKTTTTTVPAKKTEAGAYVAPPPCGTKYKYSTSTYSATAAYNPGPGPGPDPALASTPSTPLLEDLPLTASSSSLRTPMPPAWPATS